MDKIGKRLGWIGLIGGGIVSVSANVRSLWLPAYVESGWHSIPEKTPQDWGAFVMAVFLPLCALVGVEMVNAWTHLSKTLRFGILGMVTFAALASSFVHIVTVMMWYGQPVMLAILATVSVDGIMILSGLALFTRTPDTDKPMDTDTDNGADSLPVDMDTPDTDTLDTTALDMDIDLSVPDTWTVDSVDTPDAPAPVDIIPTPRRTVRPVSADGWKATALEAFRTGEPATDREIAEKILADLPETWATVEAGRKAVSRLRKAYAESA